MGGASLGSNRLHFAIFYATFKTTPIVRNVLFDLVRYENCTKIYYFAQLRLWFKYLWRVCIIVYMRSLLPYCQRVLTCLNMLSVGMGVPKYSTGGVTNHRTGPHRTAPGRIKRQTEKKDASYKSLLACKLLKGRLNPLSWADRLSWSDGVVKRLIQNWLIWPCVLDVSN